MRLVSLTLVLLWTAGASAAASTADEARAWIKRMNDALVNRNYDGVLTHKWQDGSESLRLVHRMREGSMVERVISTDGSRREEIRNGAQWVVYLPERRIALVQTRNRSFGYIATLNGLSADSEKYYVINGGGMQRLLGWPKPTQVISVEPRDSLRYGYRFWLDPQSAMPVKTQLVTKAGEVIDEISFSSLQLLDIIPDEVLRPAVDAKKFHWMSRDVHSEPVKRAFVPRANLLPTGFRVIQSSPAIETGTDGPKTRFIVSDGVAWVSVVVTMAGQPQSAGFADGFGPPMGASATYVMGRENHYISVMGEVPPMVVKSIAEAFRPE